MNRLYFGINTCIIELDSFEFNILNKNVILIIEMNIEMIFDCNESGDGFGSRKTSQENSEKQSGIIRMKKFHFVMLLFFTVFLTAGITTFALAFGNEKAVTVGTERREFEKLYTAYDTLKESYYKKLIRKNLLTVRSTECLNHLETLIQTI